MDLELTRIFVKVVQNQSFSRAAELLKQPKSAISKAVTRLEQETGTKLLIRTTRSLTLTAAGRSFYETCLGPVQILEDAQKSLDGKDTLLSGRVKLTAPEDLGSQVISPALGRLAKIHPGLSFEMVYTDQIVDLVKEGFDFAIRLGKLRENRLKAKKVGDVFLITVASPEYLKSFVKIRHPQDLQNHCCLTLNARTMVSHWSLRSKKESATVPIKARLICNQTSSLAKAALAGAGIALVPQFLCEEEIRSGRLVRVLQEWSTPPVPASLISPMSASSSARLKVTTDAIAEATKAALSGI